VANIWNFLGANVAEIIALCALLFTAWNVWIQRRHNILSVRPYITRFVHLKRNEGVTEAKVEVMNHGLGPAFIKQFTTFLDKKECDYDEALDELLRDIKYDESRSKLGPTYALLPGEVKVLLSLTLPFIEKEKYVPILEKFDRLDVAIDYTCAYGNKYHFDTFSEEDV
jgi:hypothetical protein